MPVLSEIISAKLSGGGAIAEEDNLEQGQIFVYSPNKYNRGPAGYGECQVWKSPGSGTATVEVWGAGGSSGKMCCCGAGIPGNPGAYLKKTITVDSDTWIRGYPGRSCSNDNLCFKGCSESSCFTICSPNGGLSGLGGANCICLCAQGGVGGMTFCSGSSQNSCCYSANGYCCRAVSSNAGAACFLICNVGYFDGKCAYGGDINCHSGVPGGCMFSCASFGSCYDYKCGGQYDHVAYPPGIISKDGGVVTFQRECYSNAYDGTGDGLHQLIGALSFAGRNSSIGGQLYTSCWSSHRQCGCYEWNHCVPHLPFGVPGYGANAEGSVRDYGVRGGHGAIRIKFVAAS
jgi:hypothetical protein